jgi:hypothetical protein
MVKLKLNAITPMSSSHVVCPSAPVSFVAADTLRLVMIRRGRSSGHGCKFDPQIRFGARTNAILVRRQKSS